MRIYFVRLGRIENQININSLGKIDPSLILITSRQCGLRYSEFRKELVFFSPMEYMRRIVCDYA